jgi:biotin-(acetyl-CoA carboxylase) ligase
VGVGINVHGPLSAELAPRAVALDQAQPGITRVAVLEAVIPRLHRLAAGGVLSELELATYRRFDWLAGRMLQQPVRGRARGVDPSGALIVETERGCQRLWAGTVVASEWTPGEEGPASGSAGLRALDG